MHRNTESKSDLNMRHDSAGPDPFHLREFTPSPEPWPEFDTLIQKHDELQNPKKISSDPAGKTTLLNLFFQKNKTQIYQIPNVFHWIWLGQNSMEKYLPNIEGIVKTNPDANCILWIDHPLPQQMNNKLKSLGIHVVQISKVLENKIGLLEPLYRFYLQQPNYGAASDILRLVILKNYGGIYTDLPDITCVANIDLLRQHSLIVNAASKGFGAVTFQNDVIIATPQHDFINYMINEIFNLHCISLSEVYIKHTQEMDRSDNKKDMTIHLTGPGVIKDVWKETHFVHYQLNTLNNRNISSFVTGNDELLILHEEFRNYFKDTALDLGLTVIVGGQGHTWIKNNSISYQNPEEAYQQLLTVVLCDLKRDPVLRMENYENITKKYPDFNNRLIADLPPNAYQIANSSDKIGFYDRIYSDQDYDSDIKNILSDKPYTGWVFEEKINADLAKRIVDAISQNSSLEVISFDSALKINPEDRMAILSAALNHPRICYINNNDRFTPEETQMILKAVKKNKNLVQMSDAYHLSENRELTTALLENIKLLQRDQVSKNKIRKNEIKKELLEDDLAVHVLSKEIITFFMQNENTNKRGAFLQSLQDPSQINRYRAYCKLQASGSHPSLFNVETKKETLGKIYESADNSIKILQKKVEEVENMINATKPKESKENKQETAKFRGQV